MSALQEITTSPMDTGNNSPCVTQPDLASSSGAWSADSGSPAARPEGVTDSALQFPPAVNDWRPAAVQSVFSKSQDAMSVNGPKSSEVVAESSSIVDDQSGVLQEGLRTSSHSECDNWMDANAGTVKSLLSEATAKLTKQSRTVEEGQVGSNAALTGLREEMMFMDTREANPVVRPDRNKLPNKDTRLLLQRKLKERQAIKQQKRLIEAQKLKQMGLLPIESAEKRRLGTKEKKSTNEQSGNSDSRTNSSSKYQTLTPKKAILPKSMPVASHSGSSTQGLLSSAMSASGMKVLPAQAGSQPIIFLSSLPTVTKPPAPMVILSPLTPGPSGTAIPANTANVTDNHKVGAGSRGDANVLQPPLDINNKQQDNLAGLAKSSSSLNPGGIQTFQTSAPTLVTGKLCNGESNIRQSSNVTPQTHPVVPPMLLSAKEASGLVQTTTATSQLAAMLTSPVGQCEHTDNSSSSTVTACSGLSRASGSTSGAGASSVLSILKGCTNLSTPVTKEHSSYYSMAQNDVLTPSGSRSSTPVPSSGGRTRHRSDTQSKSQSKGSSKTVSTLLKETRGYGPQADTKNYVNDRRPVSQLLQESRRRRQCSAPDTPVQSPLPAGSSDPGLLLHTIILNNGIPIQQKTVSVATPPVNDGSTPQWPARTSSALTLTEAPETCTTTAVTTNMNKGLQQPVFIVSASGTGKPVNKQDSNNNHHSSAGQIVTQANTERGTELKQEFDHSISTDSRDSFCGSIKSQLSSHASPAHTVPMIRGHGAPEECILGVSQGGRGHAEEESLAQYASPIPSSSELADITPTISQIVGASDLTTLGDSDTEFITNQFAGHMSISNHPGLRRGHRGEDHELTATSDHSAGMAGGSMTSDCSTLRQPYPPLFTLGSYNQAFPQTSSQQLQQETSSAIPTDFKSSEYVAVGQTYSANNQSGLTDGSFLHCSDVKRQANNNNTQSTFFNSSYFSSQAQNAGFGASTVQSAGENILSNTSLPGNGLDLGKPGTDISTYQSTPGLSFGVEEDPTVVNMCDKGLSGKVTGRRQTDSFLPPSTELLPPKRSLHTAGGNLAERTDGGKRMRHRSAQDAHSLAKKACKAGTYSTLAALLSAEQNPVNMDLTQSRKVSNGLRPASLAINQHAPGLNMASVSNEPESPFSPEITDIMGADGTGIDASMAGAGISFRSHSVPALYVGGQTGEAAHTLASMAALDSMMESSQQPDLTVLLQNKLNDEVLPRGRGQQQQQQEKYEYNARRNLTGMLSAGPSQAVDSFCASGMARGDHMISGISMQSETHFTNNPPVRLPTQGSYCQDGVPTPPSSDNPTPDFSTDLSHLSDAGPGFSLSQTSAAGALLSSNLDTPSSMGPLTPQDGQDLGGKDPLLSAAMSCPGDETVITHPGLVGGLEATGQQIDSAVMDWFST